MADAKQDTTATHAKSPVASDNDTESTEPIDDHRPKVHEEPDIDVVWHNLDADSSFSIMRGWSCGPIERILADFGEVVKTGVFEQVVSVCASKYMFTATVGTSKGNEEIGKHFFFVQSGEREGMES